MAKKTIKAQMKQRRDTKANWASTNPVLLDGELGIVSDDPNLYKVGDGTTAWNALPFRGFDGTLAQELGTSPNAVISQKVVSEKLTELELEKANNYISNSIVVNSAIKELYISTPFDISQEVVFRFFYLQGKNKITGFTIFDNEYNVLCDAQKSIADDEQLKAWTTTLFSNGKNFFAVVDWEKVQEIVAVKGYGYDDIKGVVLHKEIFDLNFAPTIKVADVERIEAEKDKELIDFYVSGETYRRYYKSLSSSANNVAYNLINGKIRAEVTETGDTNGFYFGFGNSYILKKGATYTLKSLYKNNGFDASKLRLLVQMYSIDWTTKVLQTTFPIKIDGDYIYCEWSYTPEEDVYLTWFCLYQNVECVHTQGATITYLGTSLHESISEKTLDGGIVRNIKEIAARTGIEKYDVVIEVYPSETPCQIANLVRSITDASSSKRYCILVRNGEYEEIDIVTKDYIDIVGESRKGAILKCTGDASYNSPEDYTFSPGLYSNVPVSTIPWNYKHLFFHMSNSMVANMTCIAISDCKYIVHQDGRYNEFTALFENCDFKNEGATQVIGIGARGGQNMIYRNCVFQKNVASSIEEKSNFNFHNWDDSIKPCSIVMENCVFLHCGYIGVSDLGSKANDEVKFINCNVDFPSICNVRHLTGDASVRYSIEIDIIGGNMQFVVSPDRKEAGFTTKSKDVILTYKRSDAIYGMAVTKYARIATSGSEDWYFAISVKDDQFIANAGNVGYCLAVADEYTQGELMYINNGIFSKSATGAVAGKVLVSTQLAEQGYVLIEKVA